MNEPQKNYTNGVLMTLSVIGMKWKPLILCHLVAGPQRPAELKRVVQGIPAKVLTDQLRELERDGIITRKVFNEVPPHVEYAISAYGKSLVSVLGTMAKWGEDRIDFLQSNGDDVQLDYRDHEKYDI